MLYTVSGGQLLSLLLTDLPVGSRTVCLIADNYPTDVLRVMLIDLLQPVLDIPEGLLVGDRIHLNSALITRMMPAAPL